MGPRNLLILFFSTVAVSLVILIIFFSLFFKNIDLNFNTKLPQSAPNIEDMYVNKGTSGTSSMNPDSKAQGLLRSTVNVPPEVTQEPVAPSHTQRHSTSQPVPDADLPPVSDDSALNDAPSGPANGEPAMPLPNNNPAPTSGNQRPERDNAQNGPAYMPPQPRHRYSGSNSDATPPAPTSPNSQPSPEGPPVPGQ